MAAPAIEPVPIVYTYTDPDVGPRFGIRSGRTAARDVQPHRHEYFEVWFFATRGATQRISFRDYSPRRGSIFFLSPMTPHQPCFNTDDACFILYFDLAFLRPELAGVQVELDAELLGRAPELAPFVCQKDIDFIVADADVDRVRSLWNRILVEQNDHRICSKQIIRSLVVQLLAEVTRKYEDQILACLAEFSPYGGGCRHVKKTLRFIADNLAKRMSLTAAARQVAVTPNYLANLLKRETGKTFVEIITEKRIEKASELLSYTGLHIAEIAYVVGFDDPDYFCKRFKLHTGCTPLEFRARRKLVMMKQSSESKRTLERRSA